MYINELEGYFGAFPEEVKGWVQSNLEKLDDNLKMNYFTALKDNCKKGIVPELNTMIRVFEKITEKKSKIFYWKICQFCKTEYAFGLPMCPKCFEEGFECSTMSVRTSNLPPPASVVKYNKEYIGEGRNCYKCQERELSYCSHFGNTKWQCKDYQICKCAACCVKEKKENEKLLANKEVTDVYAVRRAI